MGNFDNKFRADRGELSPEQSKQTANMIRNDSIKKYKVDLDFRYE